MGSAILATCARRGKAVIGLEQFKRGHDFGASSGKTRMIRKAYFEDPAYVPLLRRTYELWRELERETNEEILRITGVLMVGREESEIISGSRRSASEHGLPIDVLSKAEISARYPNLRTHEGEIGVFEPEGGVLKPERAIEAQLNVASAHGAEMQFGVALKNWRATRDGFEILLADETRISARVLVLSLGPWFKTTLESLGVPMRVQRNVQAWFTSRMAEYEVGRFPAFLVDRKEFPAPIYGFPDFGDGIKAAFHGAGDLIDAEHCDREIDHERDIAPLAELLEEWMPGAFGPLREAKTCMYSLTPDEHFVIDRHPEHANLILCGGFSGHGFKFAPVVGEIGADLGLKGGTFHPIDFLSLRRFSPQS
jgi:sarcosine oxidase